MSSHVSGTGQSPDFSKLDKYIEPEFGAGDKNAARVLGSKVCTKLIRLGHLAKTIFQKGKHAEWINNKDIIGRIEFKLVTLEGSYNNKNLDDTDRDTLNKMADSIDKLKKQMKKDGATDKTLEDLDRRIEILRQSIPTKRKDNGDSGSTVLSVLPPNIAKVPPEVIGSTAGVSARAAGSQVDLQRVFSNVYPTDIPELQAIKQDIASVEEEVLNQSESLSLSIPLCDQLVDEYVDERPTSETKQALENYKTTIDGAFEDAKAFEMNGHTGSASDILEALANTNNRILDLVFKKDNDKVNLAALLRDETDKLKEVLKEVSKADAKRENQVQQLEQNMAQEAPEDRLVVSRRTEERVASPSRTEQSPLAVVKQNFNAMMQRTIQVENLIQGMSDGQKSSVTIDLDQTQLRELLKGTGVVVSEQAYPIQIEIEFERSGNSIKDVSVTLPDAFRAKIEGARRPAMEAATKEAEVKEQPPVVKENRVEEVGARKTESEVDKILAAINNVKLIGIQGINLPRVSKDKSQNVNITSKMASSMLYAVGKRHNLTPSQITKLTQFLLKQQVKVYEHAKTTHTQLTDASKEAVRGFLENMTAEVETPAITQKPQGAWEKPIAQTKAQVAAEAVLKANVKVSNSDTKVEDKAPEKKPLTVKATASKKTLKYAAEEKVIPEVERLEAKVVEATKSTMTPEIAKKVEGKQQNDLGSWSKNLKEKRAENDAKAKAAEEARDKESKTYAAKAKTAAEISQPVKGETEAEKAAKIERAKIAKAQFEKETRSQRVDAKAEPKVETKKVGGEPIPKFEKFEPVKGTTEKGGNRFQGLESEVEAPGVSEQLSAKDPMAKIRGKVDRKISEFDARRKELIEGIGGLEVSDQLAADVGDAVSTLQSLAAKEFAKTDSGDEVRQHSKDIKDAIETVETILSHRMEYAEKAQEAEERYEAVCKELEAKIEDLEKKHPNALYDIGRMKLTLSDLRKGHDEIVNGLNKDQSMLVAKLMSFTKKIDEGCEKAKERLGVDPVGDDPIEQLEAEEGRIADGVKGVLTPDNILELRLRVSKDVSDEINRCIDELEDFRNTQLQSVKGALKDFLDSAIEDAIGNLDILRKEPIQEDSDAEAYETWSNTLMKDANSILDVVKEKANEELVLFRKNQNLETLLKGKITIAKDWDLDLELPSALEKAEEIRKNADKVLSEGGDLEDYNNSIMDANNVLAFALDRYDEIELEGKISTDQATKKEKKVYIDIQRNKIAKAIDDLSKEIAGFKGSTEGVVKLSKDVSEEIDRVQNQQEEKLDALESDDSIPGFRGEGFFGTGPSKVNVDTLTGKQLQDYRKKVDAAIAETQSAFENIAPFSQIVAETKKLQEARAKLDSEIIRFRKEKVLHMAADLEAVKRRLDGIFKLEAKAADDVINEIREDIQTIEKAIEEADSTYRSQFLLESLRVTLPEGKLRMMEYLEKKHGKNADTLEDYQTLRKELLKPVKAEVNRVVTEGERIIQSELKIIEELENDINAPVLKEVKQTIVDRKNSISRLKKETVESGWFSESTKDIEKLNSKEIRKVVADAQRAVDVETTILSEDPYEIHVLADEYKKFEEVKAEVEEAIKNLKKADGDSVAQIRVATELEKDVEEILRRPAPKSDSADLRPLVDVIAGQREELEHLLDTLPQRKLDSDLISQMMEVDIDSPAVQLIREEVVKNIQEDVKDFLRETEHLLNGYLGARPKSVTNTPTINESISPELKTAFKNAKLKAEALLKKYDSSLQASDKMDQVALLKLRKEADKALSEAREIIRPYRLALESALEAEKQFEKANSDAYKTAEKLAEKLIEYPDQVYTERMFGQDFKRAVIIQEKLQKQMPKTLDDLVARTTEMRQSADRLSKHCRVAERLTQMTLAAQLRVVEGNEKLAKMDFGKEIVKGVKGKIVEHKAVLATKKGEMDKELSRMRTEITKFYMRVNKDKTVTTQLGQWQGLASEENKLLSSLMKGLSEKSPDQQIVDAEEILRLIDKALNSAGLVASMSPERESILGHLQSAETLTKEIKKLESIIGEES